MKQRLFLSVLSIVALVYFALPRLPIHKEGVALAFAVVWLGFCVMAFGGNMSVLLYNTRGKNMKKRAKSHQSKRSGSRERRKMEI